MSGYVAAISQLSASGQKMTREGEREGERERERTGAMELSPKTFNFFNYERSQKRNSRMN